MIIEQEFQLCHTRLTALCSENFNLEKTNNTLVLALHGWLDNAASFDNLMQAIPSWPWCAIDFCGHGLSEHRPAGCFYHLWDYALDIVQLIEKLDVKDNSISLIGHSMGGAVATLLATIIPEKIKHLILLDNVGPFTTIPAERVDRLQHAIHSMGKLQRKKSKLHANQQSMIEARMNGFTSLGFHAANKLVARGSEVNGDGLYKWRHDLKLTLTTPFTMDVDSVDAIAKRVTCPTLLLLANEGVYSKHNKTTERIINCFPHKTVEWLNGGHHFHLEDDSYFEVVTSIKNFIKNT